jgi:hypothetical protein
MDDRPLYLHDCKDCIYLGNYENCDLYVCGESVVARRSSEPSDYDSGSVYNGRFYAALVVGSPSYLILEKALKRAEAKGSNIWSY